MNNPWMILVVPLAGLYGLLFFSVRWVRRRVAAIYKRINSQPPEGRP